MSQTPPPTITPSPVAPDRADRATFSPRATAWADWVKDHAVAEIAAVATNVYNNAVDAFNSATTATAQAGIATTQAGNAATQAGNAASSAAAAAASALEAAGLVESYQGALAADPTLDKDSNPLAAGDWYINTATGFVRAYNGSAWVQGISVVAGVSSLNGLVGDLTGFVTETGAQSLTNKTLTDPKLSLGGTNGTAGQVPVSQGAGLPPVWNDLPAGPEIIRVARTSNTQLTSANRSSLIDITTGTFTQTFDACSSLGDGWFVYIRNAGTGDVTLDPNASETIDGLTSFVMYPGEVRMVQCDGTALRSVVLNAFYRTFTVSGTFTKPPGYSVFSGLLWAGGASGTGNNTNAGGGGGGACAPFSIATSAFGTTETVTIGAGGAASAGSGVAGGNSALGSLVAAYGGGAPSTYPAGGGGLISAGGSNYGGKPTTQNYVAGNTDNQTFCGAFGGGSPTHVSNGYSISQQPIYGGGSGASEPGNAQEGKNSVWGGAGGGSISSSSAIAPGVSKYGGNGGAASTSTAGSPGVAPGGGGGASMTSTSGAGARGELRIWGII